MIEPFTCDLLGGRIVFGAGTLDRIRDEIEALGCSRILVIAGGSNRPGGERVASLLGGLTVGTLATVRQHVPEDLAAQVVDTGRSVRADGVVSVGGGSTIGLGKVVAVDRRCATRRRAHDVRGVGDDPDLRHHRRSAEGHPAGPGRAAEAW